jgi:hypothetical protein
MPFKMYITYEINKNMLFLHVQVQDYRFLCPNDTSFDQENQICANWFDIDCEAATLYYSDNFDLYRIGKLKRSRLCSTQKE